MRRQSAERQVQGAWDPLGVVFARLTHVDRRDQSPRDCVVRDRWAEARGRLGEVRTVRQREQAVVQVTDDVVEADAAEAHARLRLGAARADDDDRLRVVEDGAGPGGVLSAESDVQAAAQVGGGEVGRVARVEQLRAVALQRQ